MIWAGMAWKWLRGLPWQLWAAVGLCVLVLALRWHWIGVGEDRVQSAWDAQEAVYAAEREAVEEAARKTEQRHRAEYKAIADRFLALQEKADEDHAAIVAGLRAGTVRVRSRFQCPAPNGVSGTPAVAGGTDPQGHTGFGVEDAAIALGIAADGDREIRRLNALIDALKAEGR